MKNPYQNSDNNKRYYTYDCFLRRKFGGKVVKVPLDGGFTCPNIDGSKGTGGCTYCNKETLSCRGKSIKEQFEIMREPLMKKWWRDGMTERYIPYFQTFTGTYAPTEKLRRLYNEALAISGTVGLSIATRADCLTDDVVDLLQEINERTFLTVELGLQTVHEESAKRINRCHTYDEFLMGYEKLKGINVCIHLINGLPFETREMMIESATEIAKLCPHAVKLHALYLQSGSAMAEQYIKEPFRILTFEEYVDIVVSQLEILPPDTVIGRITGDGKAESLIEPMWSLKKFVVMNEIDKEFVRRDSYQGKMYGIKKR